MKMPGFTAEAAAFSHFGKRGKTFLPETGPVVTPGVIPGPIDYVLCVLACYEYAPPQFRSQCPIFCSALLP